MDGTSENQNGNKNYCKQSKMRTQNIRFVRHNKSSIKEKILKICNHSLEGKKRSTKISWQHSLKNRESQQNELKASKRK